MFKEKIRQTLTMSNFPDIRYNMEIQSGMVYINMRRTSKFVSDLNQSISPTAGTALPFVSEWLLYPAFGSQHAPHPTPTCPPYRHNL